MRTFVPAVVSREAPGQAQEKTHQRDQRFTSGGSAGTNNELSAGPAKHQRGQRKREGSATSSRPGEA